MNWIKDTYETLEGTTEPGVITGKNLASGGGEGRVEATGRSTVLAAREAFEYLDMDLEGDRRRPGYGNAGWIAARLIDEMGATVVAVSDSSGGIYNADGLDPVAAKDHKTRPAVSSAIRRPTMRLRTELLTLDVDLLIPAALENAIDGELAEDVQADVISEAANGPLTPEADAVLEDKDVFVIPDILANAGGVTVSYFEWVQNSQRFSWTEEKVNAELEAVIVEAFDGLVETIEFDLDNPRTAAYVVAVQRVADAFETGSFP